MATNVIDVHRNDMKPVNCWMRGSTYRHNPVL